MSRLDIKGATGKLAVLVFGAAVSGDLVDLAADWLLNRKHVSFLPVLSQAEKWIFGDECIKTWNDMEPAERMAELCWYLNSVCIGGFPFGQLTEVVGGVTNVVRYGSDPRPAVLEQLSFPHSSFFARWITEWAKATGKLMEGEYAEAMRHTLAPISATRAIYGVAMKFTEGEIWSPPAERGELVEGEENGEEIDFGNLDSAEEEIDFGNLD